MTTYFEQIHSCDAGRYLMYEYIFYTDQNPKVCYLCKQPYKVFKQEDTKIFYSKICDPNSFTE